MKDPYEALGIEKTASPDDIRLDLPITLAEAVLGGQVPVPTPTGTVMMRVPKHANTGAVLRLKGKGVPRRCSTISAPSW